MAAERKYGRAKRRVQDRLTQIAPTVRVSPLFPLVPAVLTFLVYMLTMSPGMQMGDGTELAAAAYVLGVPHPTGYPLYMLLCKLWLIITVAGDPILRMTLLNAVLMSAAVGITALILVDLLRYLWQTAADKSMLILAAGGALAVGFLRFHWSNAVVTEVYALQFLITVVFVRCIQTVDLHGRVHRSGLLAITACLALGLAHHRLSITMNLPWAAVWFLAWRSRSSTSNSGSTELVRLPYLWGAFILLTGAMFYAYIPLRASAQPPINWGNATTFERFYNHVRGTEYLDRGLMKSELGKTFSGDLQRRFVEYQTMHLLTDMVGQFFSVEETRRQVSQQKVFVTSGKLVMLFGLMLTALSMWGLLRIWLARQKLFALAMTTVAIQNVMILYIYNIPDIRDYFLFPLWTAWIGIMAALAWLMGKLPLHRRLFASYLALLLPAVVLTGNWSRSNRSQDVSAEVLSEMILPTETNIMPSGSILITDEDSETFTTWYRQNVRGSRPDVLNFAGNFVYMPWYIAFFTEAQRKEYGINLAPDVAQSAEEYAMQIRRAIIDKNIAAHPVFTSINDRPVLQAWAETYEVTPVDAAGVVNSSLFDKPTSVVLYRISAKEVVE